MISCIPWNISNSFLICRNYRYVTNYSHLSHAIELLEFHRQYQCHRGPERYMFTIHKVVYYPSTNALLMTQLKRFHLILVLCGTVNGTQYDCKLSNQYCKFNSDDDATNNTNGACEGKLAKGSIFSNKFLVHFVRQYH